MQTLDNCFEPLALISQAQHNLSLALLGLSSPWEHVRTSMKFVDMQALACEYRPRIWSLSNVELGSESWLKSEIPAPCQTIKAQVT